MSDFLVFTEKDGQRTAVNLTNVLSFTSFGTDETILYMVGGGMLTVATPLDEVLRELGYIEIQGRLEYGDHS